MKESFVAWLLNDKTWAGLLFVFVLLVWWQTREKELFRFMDIILGAVVGWGAGKASKSNPTEGTK